MNTDTLTIFGASDDLLEVEGAVSDEFDVPGDITIVVEAPDGERLWVQAAFCGTPSIRGVGEGWCLAILHADPDRAWPWPIRLGARPDRGSDPALHIECPDGTTVREWAETDR